MRNNQSAVAAAKDSQNVEANEFQSKIRDLKSKIKMVVEAAGIEPASKGCDQ